MRQQRITESVRERVARAARYRCGYCLTSQQVIGPLLEIDHIVPQARGGSSHERNLWLACPLCNSHKADRIDAVDPVTGETVRLFHPQRDRWTEHFEWTDGDAVVEGRTVIGRATVNALHMNDVSMVITRRLWVIAGWHPPKDLDQGQLPPTPTRIGH